MRKLYLRLAAATAFVSAPVLSFAVATPIDSTDVVAQIAEINTYVLAVGSALMVAAAIAVAVKWGKATIFG